ncbi:hypothetical protein TSUD_184010 [Trifolium subterraneum]|uniref:Protein FAR1-RELATED SEQUENCE n=1 Tax=Trifolium subterraneum TaxID=3900 RepID=A0A2Z6MIG3_TRISU|nr:hypothetical protein TSUD_184010 [Trifolium subterraneum]
MEFESEVAAYDFYNEYNKKMGFGIRREYGNKSKIDGILTSRRFTCFKEGKRGVDKRDYFTKDPRAETRTGCQARMVISLDRKIGKYKVVDFVAEHNHILQPNEVLDSRLLLEACIDLHEEENEFLSAWEDLLVEHNVPNDSWLHTIFRVKEKWTWAYVRKTFTAGTCIKVLEEGVYIVTNYDNGKERKVTGNLLDQKVSCDCRKFETHGILCSHAIKVLDAMNIKLIPEHYILKRWTRDARLGSNMDWKGQHIDLDIKAHFMKRYNELCPRMVKLINRASETHETYTFMSKVYEESGKIVENMLAKKSTDVESIGIPHVSISISTGEIDNNVDTIDVGGPRGIKKKDRLSTIGIRLQFNLSISTSSNWDCISTWDCKSTWNCKST